MQIATEIGQPEYQRFLEMLCLSSVTERTYEAGTWTIQVYRIRVECSDARN